MISSEQKCAIVIIDPQARLMPVIHEEAKIAKVIRDLAKFADIADIPVVVTEQKKLGETLPEISDEIPGFKAIEKTSFSCFGCDGFCSELDRLNPDVLIIAGVEAHICVLQTALDAIGKYEVHVISDAVGSRTTQNRDAALDRMRSKGVVISTKEMLFYEILKTAESPNFRQVLPLVK